MLILEWNRKYFGSEMRVLRHLPAGMFTCSHSGTYRDPVTDKIRQYDIRAHKDRGGLTLAPAAESKNLRPNNPLLLSGREEHSGDLMSNDEARWNTTPTGPEVVTFDALA
jgi:hypothetical protein